MHIGVDCDGVLYDFTEDARLVVAQHLGTEYTNLEPAKVWDFMTEQWGLDQRTFWKLWFKAVRDDDAWFRLPPVEGSVEGLKRLQKAGHKIHIVTSRKGGELNTVRWIQEYGIPYDTLHIGRDKTRVNVDVLVDDWEKNWHEIRDTGGRCIIWDQPWNSHLLEAERVWGWGGVLELLNED